MLTYVPFSELNGKHLDRIAATLLVPPPQQRIDGTEFLRGLQNGSLRCFEWKHGLIVVGVGDGRLSLEIVHCDHLIQDVIPLVADLRRLAADWQCDTIETMVFDTRLASVIQKLGGRVESTTLTLAVEPPDEE